MIQQYLLCTIINSENSEISAVFTKQYSKEIRKNLERIYTSEMYTCTKKNEKFKPGLKCSIVQACMFTLARLL